LREKLLIVGPVYDKVDKIEKAAMLASKYQFVIFNGNMCYPYDDIALIKSRIKLIEGYLKQNIFYNLGGYDIKLLNILRENNEYDDVQHWILSKPNVIIADYERSRFIITGGGIPARMTQVIELSNNIETSFVSYIDSSPWHKYYSGKLGYVVSNNPLTKIAPEFYNFSAQIGNVYSEDNEVYAQEIDEYGLKETILL
jgi:hypothetical protein